MIYDSDIVITHLPEKPHGDRDLENFRTQIRRGVRLNKRLHDMYARELYMVGTEDDLEQGMSFFMESAADTRRDKDEVMEACCVVARAARLMEEPVIFFKYASKVIAQDGCSEICCELGHFYEDAGDLEEATIWYYNAVYETEPILSIKTGNREPLEGLVRCYETMGKDEELSRYMEELANLDEK